VSVKLGKRIPHFSSIDPAAVVVPTKVRQRIKDVTQRPTEAI
jgi:hypothetical protein